MTNKLTRVILGLAAIFACNACTIGFDEDAIARYAARKAALQAKAEAKGIRFSEYETANEAGYNIAVLDNQGEGSIRVVTIPGAPSEHIYWSDFVAGVDPEVEFFVIERPGYGESGPGYAVTDLDEQRDAVLPLLAEEQSTCTFVMGSSYGGAIALSTALTEPDVVDGVILVSALITTPKRGLRFWTFVGSAIAPVVNYGDEIDTIRREIVNAPGQRRKIIDALDNLSVPVVVIHGEEDNVVPVDNASFIRNRLDGVTPVDVTILPGVSHEVMIDEPEAIYGAIERMVAATRGKGTC